MQLLMGVPVTIAHALLCVLATVFVSFRFVHILQLESYQLKSYFRWLGKHFISDMASYILLGVIALSLELVRVFFTPVNRTMAFVSYYAAEWLYLALLVLFGYTRARRKAKMPLVYTSRVKRLSVLLAVLTGLFYFELFVGFKPSEWGGFLLSRLLHYAPGMFLPLFVALGAALILPVEWLIKRWYFFRAQKKLKEHDDVMRIGITGSYGKTSMKFMLGALLSQKFKPLVPPSSYNTPMGLTRVIREQLTKEHDVFLAEMGARHVGDIKELCTLVSPMIGVLTSVGKQHLETFGSLENVTKTKNELILALPERGAAFFNGENEICRELYAACALKQKYLYGFSEKMYMSALDINVGPNGSEFLLKPANAGGVMCKTVLLGKHNILNLVGAAAVAHRLGVSVEKISAAIAALEPVEHRLALIRGPVSVIDDAFNSNPEGAKAAFEVLRAFEGRKIVVTPGMVELGEEEAALNEAFGEDLAISADIAILVGKKRVESIIKGMKAKGFADENIITVATLDEASERLAGITSEGDVVLFENDLPDNFNE